MDAVSIDFERTLVHITQLGIFTFYISIINLNKDWNFVSKLMF